MKICITSSGEDLDSVLDSRFGRCPYFLIVDSDTKNVEAIKNTGVRASRGAGVTAAQIAADSGCDVVITGNIGPNAFTVLHDSADIEIYSGNIGKSCAENLRAFNNGELEEITSVRPGFGRGFGRGGAGQGPAGGGRGGRGPTPSGAGRGRRGGRS